MALFDSDCATNVMIVGGNTMQNDLFASFLAAQAELKCMTCAPSQLSSKLRDEIIAGTLFLIDAQNADLFSLVRTISVEGNGAGSLHRSAAYNVEPSDGIDQKALNNGLQGIFYKDEPIDYIAKGVKAMLVGEYWYSRKSLSAYVASQRALLSMQNDNAGELTAREKEVLLKIYTGKSNKAIADELCVSHHTVKTHIYNIYRKINVDNRFQATLWAAKNL